MNKENVLPTHSQVRKESVNQNNSLKKSGQTQNYHEQACHTITDENIFKKFPHNESFFREEQCLEYLKNKKSIYLFGEDYKSNNAKQFFALSYKTIYSLSIKKQFHLYEYFGKEDKLKLFLDIDIKPPNIPTDVDQTMFFDNILNKSINTVIDYLKEYKVTNPQYIILSACGESKLSAHVIFPNVVFKHVYEMRFFMSNIKSHLIDKKIIDMNPYKKGCFRMLWNSKYGSNRFFKFYKSINYTHNNNKQLFMDCLLRNLPKDYQLVEIELPKDVKIIKRVKPAKSQYINNVEYNKTNLPVNLLKKYVDILDSSRADDYNEWLRIGMILYNSNPTSKSLALWDGWSKQSVSYSSKDYNTYKWNSFKFGRLSMGTLKYLAKMDNPEKYGDIEYSLEEPIYETIKFTSDYLLNSKKENIKDDKSFISGKIIEWLTTDTKILAIKSSYDTGKTTTVYKIITEFGIIRVLFISYRQTLTNDLYGNFKDIGVESYLDKIYTSDKLICQIESLHKLMPKMQFFDDDNLVPVYDLVVLDEVESILNHFKSPTIKNKSHTFYLFRDILFNAKKILALDGDFNNRAYHFLKYFEEPIILENQIKKNLMHYIFTNNRPDFESRMDFDLKNKKNICIVSMSSKLAIEFYERYSKKYKTVIHCARSDDQNKQKLMNVKKFWKQFQVVIYSPSIESGVNFDISHFDKIYGVLSSKSTSPRGLMQMLARVRKIKDRNIMIYLNNIPFKEKGNFYTYDEVKEYICETLHDYVEPERFLDDKSGKMVVKYNFGLHEDILVHNETEVANKNRNLFVPYLIKLMKEKGHTYERINVRQNKNAYDKDMLTKDDILKTDDIDKKEFNKLLSKQINNEATKEDKLKVERFLIRKDWKINDKITDDFLTKFYGKTYVLVNLRCLLDKSKVDVYMSDMNGKYTIDFDAAHKLGQIKMIQEVINKLGFTGIGNDQKLNKETFEKNMDDVINGCKLFIDTNKSQPMFGYDKVKICKVKTIRQFMGFINSLFSEWGIIIGTDKKYKCQKINNKWKTLAILKYKLNYINNINLYI